MDDKIDILMATFNGENYLKQQIDSILNQKYNNFNLIISDDCSSDSTIDILKEYEKKDDRITVHTQNKNLGYRKNFEFLVKKTTCKYVMFSDQDDIWDDSKIEKMYYFIVREKSKLVYCDLKVVDRNLNELFPSMVKLTNMYSKSKKYNNFDLLKLENAVTGCATIVERDILQKALPFPSDFFVHDWWLGLIATQYGKIHFLDEGLVLYRQHDNNSIGIKGFKVKSKNFDEYRYDKINYRINQFGIMKSRQDQFVDLYSKKVIDAGYRYFNNLKIRNISYLLFIMKKENIFKKIKWICLFNFPFIYKIFYNIKKG